MGRVTSTKPAAARPAVPRDPLKDLARLGKLDVRLTDSSGRKIYHWKEGNPAEGVLKTMEILSQKAGLSPDLIIEEFRRRHPEAAERRRRR